MTLQEVQDAITKLNRPNGAFYGFETITKPKCKVYHRTNGKKCDFTLQIKKRFTAKLGLDYGNIVNYRREKEGLERDFVPQMPKGRESFNGSKIFLTDTATHSKYYVAMDCVSKAEEVYLIDGREATEDEVKDIKENWLSVSKPSPNNMGVIWRTYGVDGIISIH